MSSRDGLVFSRWPDPIIPVTSSESRAGNRSNYMAWGLLHLPGRRSEYSVYATESYLGDRSTLLRRFTYRLDGFVALQAKGAGEMITRPVIFDGNGMEINFKTSRHGGIKIEVQSPEGDPVNGFAAVDCQPLRGDRIAGRVCWSGGRGLANLKGRPVRLSFKLTDAAIYSFRFDQF